MSSRTISTTAEELISRSRLRNSFAVKNEDASINIFIKRERTPSTTVSATDHDWEIAPEAALAFDTELDGAEAVQDRWTVVAASGTPRISVVETEDTVR